MGRVIRAMLFGANLFAVILFGLRFIQGGEQSDLFITIINLFAVSVNFPFS